MRFGYKASAEQFGPNDLLRFAVEAERDQAQRQQQGRRRGGLSPLL